jgi:iron only hydrogenase large subunit-like protein
MPTKNYLMNMKLLTVYLALLLPIVTGFSVLPMTRSVVRVASPETKLWVAATKEKLTKEAEELLEVLDAKDEDRHGLVVAQVAPAVRVTIPEEFGLEPGTIPVGKLVTALKQLGFDLVLDTNTGADITICEEATELLHRIQARVENANIKQFGEGNPGPEPLPLFTSCCPGWLNMVAKHAPEIASYVSTCKSPHMMYGAIVKEYSEEMLGQPADKVYLCSVMVS